MAIVAIDEIRKAVRKSLQNTQKFDAAEVAILVDEFMEGELQDKKTHGLNNLPLFVQYLSDRPTPKLINETASSMFVDANGDVGVLHAIKVANKLIEKASTQGVAVGYIRNAKPILRPSYIADYVARKDMVGFVVNSGGPPMMAHPDGVEPVVGTNPIGFSIPKLDGTISADMATSKRAWGAVATALENNAELPANSYKDSRGNITRNPNNAYTAVPAESYKGFALATFIEIMCGSFIGMDVGGSRSDTIHRAQSRGIMILVFDPAFTVGRENFKKENADFVTKVKQTDAGRNILMPGERAAQRKQVHLTDGYLDMSDRLWEQLLELANS